MDYNKIKKEKSVPIWGHGLNIFFNFWTILFQGKLTKGQWKSCKANFSNGQVNKSVRFGYFSTPSGLSKIRVFFRKEIKLLSAVTMDIS